jgi:hypothetical protein
MRLFLLLTQVVLVVISTVLYATPLPVEPTAYHRLMNRVLDLVHPDSYCHLYTTKPLNHIKMMLHREAPMLNEEALNKAITVLNCANNNNVYHNDILSIIDYSKSAGEKRLWVFDLKKERLLFHTYVSHGIKSGLRATRYFSNKNNSKSSSIGVYRTAQTYHGRDGLSLRLHGLDRGFNDNAENRSIVMHGGWYVEEPFIKKYARAGRSWGCPAVPLTLTEPIIQTIKNGSLLVIYYPSERWFTHSRFLTCDKFSSIPSVETRQADESQFLDNKEKREEILFADLSKKHAYDENKPMLVMSADEYQTMFNVQAPLVRMLRRQINHKEYVALSPQELNTLITINNRLETSMSSFNMIKFVIPAITMVRGYYVTNMKLVNFGTIKSISEQSDKEGYRYELSVENSSPITLRSSSTFIRWLGL